MSARTKHRLEKRVDEMHGWALERSNEKVVAFETQLEEETYRHLLENEACHMRAKNQKKRIRILWRRQRKDSKTDKT